TSWKRRAPARGDYRTAAAGPSSARLRVGRRPGPAARDAAPRGHEAALEERLRPLGPGRLVEAAPVEGPQPFPRAVVQPTLEAAPGRHVGAVLGRHVHPSAIR